MTTATDAIVVTDVGAIIALKDAAAALDAAARVLEHIHGKGCPQAEAVLVLFDRTHDLLGPRGF